MRSSSAGGEQATISPELMVAAEIGAELTAVSSLPDLLQTLRRRLKWLLPAAHVSLSLLEDDGLHYRTLAPDGAAAVYLLDDGLIGWALRERMALDVVDVQDETHLPLGVGGGAVQQGQGSLLVLPLRSQDRLLGALAVGSPRVGAYTAIDRGIVNLVVEQVASAVRIALLMAELDGAESIIAGMVRAVEAKDPYTQGHADRVTRYAVELAGAAALPTHIRDLVARAGPLHDVGKIGVPDAVLRKAGRLSDEEFAHIRRHPEIGDEICRPLRSLQRLRPGIRHHHERYDGHGYPDGLSGEAIPLEARVLAIADAFDAMTSTRPYRAGMPVGRALAIITANEGPQWDPALVPTFCALHQDAKRTRPAA